MKDQATPNPNKQVTAEEIYQKHEHAASTDINYPMENGFSFMKNAMEEYATLKTQQLTAENEALQKRLEENRKSFRADLHHLRKHKAKLKAEIERLRKIAFTSRGLGIMIHDKLSKLDIPMEEYTPISELLINLKTLLQESQK